MLPEHLPADGHNGRELVAVSTDTAHFDLVVDGLVWTLRKRQRAPGRVQGLEHLIFGPGIHVHAVRYRQAAAIVWLRLFTIHFCGSFRTSDTHLDPWNAGGDVGTIRDAEWVCIQTYNGGCRNPAGSPRYLYHP
jgi:hypothetical protein